MYHRRHDHDDRSYCGNRFGGAGAGASAGRGDSILFEEEHQRNTCHSNAPAYFHDDDAECWHGVSFTNW